VVCFFTSGFLKNFPMNATCLAHLILLNLITQIILRRGDFDRPRKRCEAETRTENRPTPSS
jgi:hypothetical protein